LRKFAFLIIAIVAIGLLGWYGCVQFKHRFLLTMDSPYLFVSDGAMEAYQAHFVTEGFQDRGISLFVSPTSGSDKAPTLVDDLAAPWCRFGEAVWSSDGSVIACRAHVTTEDAVNSARKERKNDEFYLPPTDCTPYACAYDFREAKAIVMKRSSFGRKADWEAHSQKIEELLKARGGLGGKVTEQEIDEHKKKMDWTQWQRYNTARRRARL
jgi:hypothetical protein